MPERRAWWKVLGAVIFWLLVAVPATLTITGFLARWHWTFGLTCHFRTQYFWILLALSSVLLLTRRFWLSLIPLAFAAVNLALIGPLYFGGNLADGPGQLRILSINVQAENHQFHKVLDLVQQTRPDFLLLIDIDYAWLHAMQPLARHFPYRRELPSPGSSGLAFYSRLPTDDLDIRPLDNFGRSIMIARVRSQGQTLTLIGLHPASPRSASSSHERDLQLATISKFVREQPNPKIAFGDMNTTSWSPAFDDFVETTALVDSRRGFGVEPTWPVWFETRIPIDHFLVSPEILVNDRWVGPDVGSDHFPVILDFSLPAAAAEKP